MSITFPLSSGWSESFAGTTTTSPSFDWGTGSNRKAYAIACYQGGISIKPTPNTLVVGGTDTLSAVGSVYDDPTTGDHFKLYEGDLTVTGSQTAVQTFTGGSGVSSGAAQVAVLVAQGGGALTRANLLSLLTQSVGGGGGTLSRSVTSTAGNKVVQIWVNNSGVTPTAVSPATLLTNSPSYAGANNFHDTASGSSTSMGSTWGAFGGGINAAFTLSEPGAAPVISSPTATATGPTQGTAGATTDTASGTAYLLSRVGGSPASAATIIATGVSVAVSSTTISRALTGLTTNTANAVDIVHVGSGGNSNVVTATLTPNTLASSGSPAAQTGTAGSSFTWTGATPQSFLTNTGNGSGAWSIVSSAGFSVAPSINTSTGVLSGGTLAAAGSYSPQVRYTDSSTVPAAQTVTFTLGLTVSSGGGGGTPVSFSGTVPAQSGTVGVAYSLALAGYFSGTLTPFTYSVLSGSLPTSVTLNTSSGALSGTPSVAGSYSAVVRATDTGSNTAQTGTIAFTIASAPSGAGTIASEPLTNNMDVPLAGMALTWVGFRQFADGSSVLVKTGITLDSSAQFSVTDAALTPGAQYIVDWVTASGMHGRAKATAT